MMISAASVAAPDAHRRRREQSPRTTAGLTLVAPWKSVVSSSVRIA